MKSYNNIYEVCTSEANRKMAVRSIKSSRRIKKTIIKRNLSDSVLSLLANDWIENFKNSNHTSIKIYDGVSRKERQIIVPSLEELTVQHCIVNAMKPMFTKGMYEHSYASLPGRGTHKGKKVIEKWIRKDFKNTKYVLKMDIRHFFDSIPHLILKNKLSRIIRDERMLRLLFETIDVIDTGLPLGFYTSQWLSNWYLQELDHYIKESLKAVYYIRYMDDMIIFGCNKKVLHEIRRSISKYLETQLGLELKRNWQVFKFVNSEKRGRDLDFMGFRFHKNKTVLRRSIMYKASRKAKRISNKERPTIYDARQMLSYLGWINCTDTYQMYARWIKPCISFQGLKRKASKHDLADDKNKYQRIVRFYQKGGKYGTNVYL